MFKYEVEHDKGNFQIESKNCYNDGDVISCKDCKYWYNKSCCQFKFSGCPQVKEMMS